MIIKKLDYLIKKTNITELIVYSYILLAVFIVIPFHIMIHYLDLNIGDVNFENDSLIKKMFLLVIFGPILETLLFQVGIISLLKRILPKLPVVSVIISALLFGLSHFYSDVYIYYTFIVGLFLATLYFIASKKEVNPFVVVFSVHAINNLLLFIVFEFIL